MKIVADDKIPFLKCVFEKYAEVVYLPGDDISNSDLQDADALLTRSITLCNEELLSNTSVKLIATATIGDDHIDKDYCDKNNISWTSAKGCNAAAVEQYFTTALLTLAEENSYELENKTIGIIGVGNIGKRVQKVAELIGLNVLLNDPPRERKEGSTAFSSLTEIQEKADIITLHVPLTFGGIDKTFHLVDQTFFDGLKKSVVFINTCRGAVVDSFYLINAINEHKISKTIIDVWENEPVIDTDLLKLVNIATPHIAGYTLEGKANGTSIVVKAISDFFGLEIGNWKPDIPAINRKLVVDCGRLSKIELLQRVFKQVYHIMRDDQIFRDRPEEFIELRRIYGYRRENDTFNLDLVGILEAYKHTLKELGFKNFNSNINTQNIN